MSLMKSLPMVARTEVLQRNIPEDWSVKDRTSCKENLHLGREDDIVKIKQVEGAKCKNTWGPTRAKGRLNRSGMGLGQSSQAGRPGPLRGSVRPPFLAPEGPSTLSSWRCCHSQRREPFAPRGHPQARERREIFWEGSLNSKEAPTSGEERRHRRKRHHDQRCHV
jgi:hypothetical protein